MKILVADDDRVSLRLMENMLLQNGYDVVTAANGREAANELSKPNGPRLALIDWMMPELDGPGVCSEVRSRQNDLYVYMMLLTSKESREDIVAGLKAGADDYLTKPCHPAELNARLHTGRRILSLEDKLVEAREEMRHKATHDSLTGLLDRGAILATFHNELVLSKETHEPVSLMLCDVDHFKQVNDTHGHLVGDEVLREVATRFMASVRSYDSVGRYGGEEFLLVVHGCDRESINGRAEDIRMAINGSEFMTKAGPLAVSISIGALTVDDWNASESVEQLLMHADMALYQAKVAGRNRVVCAEPRTAVNATDRSAKKSITDARPF